MVEIESVIDDELLPKLVKKTTQLLEKSTEELKKITWSDSEANT